MTDLIDFIKDTLSLLSSKRVIESDIQSESIGRSNRYYPDVKNRKKILFEEIVSHDIVKRIFVKALISSEPVHILLVGTPGSAKSMFMGEIMRCFKSSLFLVRSNSTKAGLINELFEKLPRYLLIDELDKMNTADQTSLLNLMETGLLSETKMNKTRSMKMNAQVFATANCRSKVIEPLLSRFVVLQLPEYTFEEFKNISLSRLRKTKLSSNIASMIIEQVWNDLESKDIRDVVKIGNLVSTGEDVSLVIKMMKNKNY